MPNKGWWHSTLFARIWHNFRMFRKVIRPGAEGAWDPINSATCLTICALLVLVGLWWVNTADLDVRIALNGSTPMEWNLGQTLPEHFRKDFPSGLSEYRTSFFMAIYPALSGILGVSVEQLMPWVIGAEILALATASAIWVRSVLPTSPPLVVYTSVLMVVASFLPKMDLARFGFAHFWGLYYTSAQVALLLALSASVRNRPRLSLALSALATLFHPVFGLFSLVFVVSAGLARGEFRSVRTWLVEGFGFLLVVAAWFFPRMKFSNFVGAGIPTTDFFALTGLCGFHWYPFKLGLFAGVEPLPLYLVCYILLAVHYAKAEDGFGSSMRTIGVGVGALLIVAVFGIVFSVAKWHPSLVKLALHRSTSVVILALLPFVVQGLWKDIIGGGRMRALGAVLVLISPFLLHPGFPLTLSLGLTWRTWLPGLKGGAGVHERLGLGLLLLLSGLMAYATLHHYWYFFFQKLLKWRSYLLLLAGIYSGFGLLLLAMLHFGRRKSLAIASLALVTMSSGLWVYRCRPRPIELERGKSYKAVQLWARDHTSIDAIFMVDPSIHYGWRAYSQRSSFGNLREWLYHWAYSSDVQHFHEGMRRFGEFDLDYHEFLNVFPSDKGFNDLSQEVQNRFYGFDDERKLSLAKKYDISYFVMEKKWITRSTRWPVAFENSEWLVLKVDKVGQG